MTYFTALLVRSGPSWSVTEASLDGCESVADVADVLRDVPGDVRLIVVEQDDEYAAIVRLDESDDDGRAFLSDAHAADSYPVAAYLAEDLEGSVDPDADDELIDGAPHAHESSPLGDASIVADLGVGAGELLAMCAHEGTLPIDVLAAVCEKAGCAEEFDELRG